MPSQTTYPQLHFQGQNYYYAPIHHVDNLTSLPFSLRILLENVMRRELRAGQKAQAEWDAILQRKIEAGIHFYPARVFGHDILGLVMLLDLVALREAVYQAGGDASRVRPMVPTDVVIDHSLQVDSWANPLAAEINLKREYERNAERFEFLRWCGANFDGVSVIPPGKGIMHQLHLEHIGQVVWTEHQGQATWLYPDSCVI